MWHIVLLPIAVVIIAGLHVLLVRRHGIVPPFDDDRQSKETVATPTEESA